MSIVNKIMQTVAIALKNAAREPQPTKVVELVRRLFNLRESTPGEARGLPAPFEQWAPIHRIEFSPITWTVCSLCFDGRSANEP
jgi:hypothetical protein